MTTGVSNTKVPLESPVESGGIPAKVAFVPDIPATKAEMERARGRQTVNNLMVKHGYEDVTELLQFFARDDERENNPHQAGDDCPSCGGDGKVDDPSNPFRQAQPCLDCRQAGTLNEDDAASLNERVRRSYTRRPHTALWLRIGERSVR